MTFPFHPPKTLSELAGWAGFCFLIGIAIHSVHPYQTTSLTTLSIVVSVLVALWFFKRTAWLTFFLVCALAILIGIWRFDVSHASLPRGLTPFSPSGLARTTFSATTANQSDPRYWLSRSRQFLTQQARQFFPGDEGALLTGILYGDRGLSKATNEQFRRASLMHIIAVSGNNVTVVVVLVMPLLLACHLSRRTAFVVLTIALAAFALFVNPTASVMRAAIMGWLIELAPIVGRIPRPSRLLLVSAVVFVFWQPWALLFDASFALSFLAMWGLLTWSPWFNDRTAKAIPWSSVRTILAATFGATIMTIPYSAWAFGQFSLFGFITSLLALPLIPWIMGFGMLALLFPLSVFILPARGFLQLILLIARIPNLFPVGVWSHLSTSFSFMATLYVVITILWLFIKRKNNAFDEKDHSFSHSASDDAALSALSDNRE